MLKKYKKIPLIITGLAGVALLTTGFSAWVISGAEAATLNDFVTIEVGDLQNKQIKAEIAATDGVLKFDSNKVGGTVIQGTEALEDMTFGGSVTISFNGETTQKMYDVLKDVTFDLQFADSSTNTELKKAQDAYTNALKSLIDEPLSTSAADDFKWTSTLSEGTQTQATDTVKWEAPSAEYLKSEVVTTYETGTNSIKLDFKFGYRWGKTFDNVNPCDAKFENDKDKVNLTAALTGLKTLKGIASTKGMFKLVVTPTTK